MFDTMVMPANTAMIQVTIASHSLGLKRIGHHPDQAASTAAPEGLGNPWK